MSASFVTFFLPSFIETGTLILYISSLVISDNFFSNGIITLVSSSASEGVWFTLFGILLTIEVYCIIQHTIKKNP